MQSEDKKRFTSLIQALAAQFRIETSEALFEGYWMALDDLSLADVERSVRAAIRGCERMPAGSELRRLAGEMTTGSRAVQAWGAMVKAIGQHGGYRSVDFDDVVINATIRNLGGWQKLCQTEEQELQKWVRKDFERIYSALTTSGITEEQAQHLVGVHEQANTAAGHQVAAPVHVATGLPPHREGVLRQLSAPERLALTAGEVSRVVALAESKGRKAV